MLSTLNTMFLSGLTLLTETLLAANGGEKNTGPRGSEFGKAEPIGLVIIVVMLIATFFLIIRGMNRHLKRLPTTFGPDSHEPMRQGTGASPDGDGVDVDADGSIETSFAENEGSADSPPQEMSYWEYRMRKRIAESNALQSQLIAEEEAAGITRRHRQANPLDGEVES